MSSSKFNLLCVAHPDDEVIFFGGLLQRRRTLPWTIVCMTDANADGDGRRRKLQFEKACRTLGAKDAQWWAFPDIYEKRLPVHDIVARLCEMPRPQSVFTHGIVGEYGHPHHQDVSFAVHTAFKDHPKVYSSAYNAFPDFSIQLTKKEFALKTKILTQVYGSETSRFLNLLPATSVEGYLQLDPHEVRAIYDYFAHRKPLKQSSLKAYAWLSSFLKSRRQQPRPF
ncbi:MAG TPA: PIG-L family deacetylase [Bdellovibrionales bacterium]|nr:PIG-L family deacetylase [Bdellovibrionales bacterium]